MKRLILAIALNAATALAVAQNYTAPWYNPAESGWGMNVTHQGDVLVPTWITYDVDGKPLWLVVSGARKQADGSYLGDIYRTTGTAFNLINGAQAMQSVNKLGSARFSFPTENDMSVTYTLNGITQSKSLKRLLIGSGTPVCEFTSASRATATNYTDMWGSDAEAGWGVNIYQQESNIYATWYTYGADSLPTWYVVSGTTKQADGSFKGALYRVNGGTPQLQINSQPAFASGAVQIVGEMTFRFTDGERGTITYTLNGLTQTKNISRFVFASPQQVCRNGNSGTGGGGGGSGQTAQCYSVPKLGEVRRYRQGTQAAPFEYTTRGMGPGTLNGKPGMMWDLLDTQNRRTNRVYARINSDGSFENIGNEIFDAASGAKTGEALFGGGTGNIVPDLAIGASATLNYQLVTKRVGQPDLTVDYRQTFTRKPNESVSVTSGSYNNACVYEGVSDATATEQGIQFSTRINTKAWSNTREGGIKVNAEGTGTVNGVTVPVNLEVTELLQFTQ
jgi:hypothetical protein